MRTILTGIFYTATTIACSGEIKVNPVMQSGLNFEWGKIGKSAVFNSNSKLYFDIGRIHPSGGTIELILKRRSGIATDISSLITVGTDRPLWFFIGEQNGILTFIFRKKSIEDGKFEYNGNIRSQTLIKDNEWTHLAFVWGYRREKGCLMQIYVNGKAAEEKFYLSIGREWSINDLIIGIGCNSANFSTPSFCGSIDEIRISNYPKTFNELNAAYEEFAIGKAPKMEQNTLLLLHFENGIEGLKTDEAQKIGNEQMIKYCEEIIKDLPD